MEKKLFHSRVTFDKHSFHNIHHLGRRPITSRHDPSDFTKVHVHGPSFSKENQRKSYVLKERSKTNAVSVVKTSSGGLTESSDLIRVEELSPVTHTDLFTEFDDAVLRDLYGENEFAVDFRYDRDDTIDAQQSANATYSSFRLLNPAPYYHVGDVIYVSIKLLDGYMNRILHGRDRIFVWIKDPKQGACASGITTDHKNGTYTGAVRVLWPGHVTIMAGIAISREAVRALYKIHLEGLMARQLFAIFQRRFRYEMTLCGPSPHLPGYSVICNMTSRHYGLPWFCGHPEVLTCAEWTRVGSSQPPWPLTDNEKNLFDLEKINQNIPKAIHINVYDGKSRHAKWRTEDTRDLIPCNELSPAATWRQKTPVGYFFNWNWRSALCRNSLPNTSESWDKCLSNRRLWLHGDSTLRQWFVLLQRRQKLNLLTEKWRYPAWPLPSTQHSRKHNYVVFWGTHGLPFSNSGEFIPVSSHIPMHVYMEQMPDGNRDIIVIHLYLHFSPFPPTLVRTHVRRTVQAIEDLMKRAPDARVFVKGPHKFHVNDFARGHVDDYWASIYDQIYKAEFKRIEHLVYYLDFWDMTVSSENFDVHPNSTIVEQMIHSMLGYICP